MMHEVERFLAIGIAQFNAVSVVRARNIGANHRIFFAVIYKLFKLSENGSFRPLLV